MLQINVLTKIIVSTAHTIILLSQIQHLAETINP